MYRDARSTELRKISCVHVVGIHLAPDEEECYTTHAVSDSVRDANFLLNLQLTFQEEICLVEFLRELAPLHFCATSCLYNDTCYYLLNIIHNYLDRAQNKTG